MTNGRQPKHENRRTIRQTEAHKERRKHGTGETKERLIKKNKKTDGDAETEPESQTEAHESMKTDAQIDIQKHKNKEGNI